MVKMPNRSRFLNRLHNQSIFCHRLHFLNLHDRFNLDRCQPWLQMILGPIAKGLGTKDLISIGWDPCKEMICSATFGMEECGAQTNTDTVQIPRAMRVI